MKLKRGNSLKELIKRLIQWLESHGHNPKEILDCLNYILGK